MTAALNSWREECARFNHGWLRNRFCQSLGAAIQIGKGEVWRGESYPDHQVWVRAWREQKCTVRQLISRCAEEMSPAELFSVPPLAALEPGDAEFFRKLTHSLWMTRHHIRERIDRAEAALNNLDPLIDELERTGELREALGSGLVRSIHAACQRLADALSELPKDIEL